MSTLDLNGLQEEYRFSRDSGTGALVVENTSTHEVTQLGDVTRVNFTDGSVSLSHGVESEGGIIVFPSLTSLSNGGFVLTWEMYSSSVDGVRVQLYDAEGQLKRDTVIESDDADNPTVAELPDGSFILAWASENDEDASYIYTQRFDSDGAAVGSPVKVASSTARELEDPTITVLGPNKYMVTWLESREDSVPTIPGSPLDWSGGEDIDGQYSVFTADVKGQIFTNGTAGAVQTLYTGTSAAGEADNTVILPQADGSFWMLWSVERYTGNDPMNPVYTTEFLVRQFGADGKAKGAVKSLEQVENGYRYSIDPSIAEVTDGYVMTWRGPVETMGGTNTGVWVQRYDQNFVEQGDPVQVTNVSQTVNGVSATALEDGGYLLAWALYPGMDQGSVYAQRFDANGNEIDQEPILVALMDEGQSVINYPVATAQPDGGFIISWTTGDNLQAQRYDSEGHLLGGINTTITGDSGNNTLTWSGEGDVTLRGEEGDDHLAGGAGNDVLDGGDGDDTAVLSGNQADYSITQGDDGQLLVSRAGELDTLIDIERIQFQDGDIEIDTGAATVEGDQSLRSETPDVVTLANGSQVLVWKQEDGLRVQRYNGDVLLSDQVLPNTSNAEEPSIAAFGDGFIVTWEGLGESPSTLYSQRFDAGAEAVGDRSALHPVNEGFDIHDASVVQLTNGDYVMAWAEESPKVWDDKNQNGFEDEGEVSGFNDTSYVQVFESNGQAKGAAVPIKASTKLGIESDEPSVSALQNGGFVVVWESEDDVTESYEIYLQRFKADGSKDGAAVRVNTGTNGDSADPEVVTLADGSYVVTWTRETHNDQRYVDPISGQTHLIMVTVDCNVFMQRYSATGAKLGGEVRANTTTGIYSDPSITALTGGGYVITWATSDEHEGPDESDAVLYAQIFDKNGIKLGNELVIDRNDDLDFFPEVTGTEDGGFIVTWEASDRSWGIELNGDIHIKRFDANGNSLSLTGDDSNNTLVWSGASGAIIDGGAGDDTLKGGDFADVLIGGTGTNQLEGGKGNDLYVIENASDVIVEAANAGTDTVKSSVSYSLGDNLENLVLSGSDDIDGTGNALNNSITGNNGANRLDGGAGADTLTGGAGNDLYVVDNLKDVIVESSTDADEIDGVISSVTWALGANLENLSLTGTAAINGTGNDKDNELIGNAGANTLTGGAGADLLYGDGGVDKLLGGIGDDTYMVDIIQKGTGPKSTIVLQDSVSETGKDARDTVILQGIVLGTAASTVVLGANLEILDARPTGDSNLNLTGNASANEIYGNDAGNIIDGGAGVDVLEGGDGDDTYVLDRVEELENVHEFADEGQDTLRIAYSNTSKTDALVLDLNALNHLENITVTGTGLFTLKGDAADNVLVGNLANNLLEGGAGNDRLDGGKGNDTLKGGEGNDTYVVDNKADAIEELAGQGVDTVESSITWSLSQGDNLEHLVLTGTGAINGTGNELANSITGNAGANILDGGLGADLLSGGKGNDTYIVDNVGDQVSENANEGIDTVKASVSYDLSLSPMENVENLILTGTDDIDGTGNGQANSITGNDGDNFLDGRAGVDKLTGGKGDDFYIVDLVRKGSGATAFVALEDIVTEAANAGIDTLKLRTEDTLATDKTTTLVLAANLENLDASSTSATKLNLTGNAKDNELSGNDADNILNGGLGDDLLFGGDGNDTLIGGVGADRLEGGAGVDTFRFGALNELGLGDQKDVILDFEHGVDKLDFSALKGWSLVEGDAAGGAKQLWIEQDGADMIVHGNSGGTLDADFSIRLAGVSELTVGDFTLV